MIFDIHNTFVFNTICCKVEGRSAKNYPKTNISIKFPGHFLFFLNFSVFDMKQSKNNKQPNFNRNN